MVNNWFKAIGFIIISMVMLFGCAGKEAHEDVGVSISGRSGTVSTSGRPTGVHVSDASSRTSQPSESFILDPDRPEEMGEYMRVKVNDFIVILDASGSKYLPYSGKIKLKVAKDIVRRFNQHTPKRPLFGGLRRYGFEAGAWSVPTALIYGMADYSRPGFARSIETVRWAGGKSPMTLAIDKASDDFQQAKGHYLALVIVSDGKIYQGDPLGAARNIKARYGDRICIYTCLVGDLPFGWDLLKRIAKAGKCGYAIKADDLDPEKTMRDWVDDVFHRGRKAEPDEPIIARPKKERPPIRERETPPIVRPAEKGPCELLDELLRRLKVQFELNKWKIRPEYRADLDYLAHLMIKCEDAILDIQGHTCNIWTEKYNMKLSHLRATEVMKYLVNRGVNPNRLAVSGAGLTIPAASNKTEGGRVANRRVEFRRSW